MNTLQDSKALADRIWTAFPVSQPTFAKLLGLLDIEVSEAVPTAAVTLGYSSRLLINPEFANRHCQTDTALVMLVLHELWHVALGHTRLYDRMTPAQNWAFDAIINAQLCRLFPDPAHTRLFRDLYSASELPWALLRPPEGWRSADARWLPGRAGEAHRSLYSDASVSTEALFRLLPTLGTEAGLGEALNGRLLGAHEDGRETAAAPEVLREIRGIVAEWPMLEKRSGRDQGQPLGHERIALGQRRENATRLLRQALARLAGVSEGHGRPRLGQGTVDSVLPYGRDRRAVVREIWGDSVPLHRAELPARSPQRRGQVHVYLDVSGSMDTVVGPLYAALAALAPWLAPRVQLFSTDIRGIPLAGLRRGDLFTTGGTHIGCVTGHILDNQVERALIVTDGWVGEIPGEHLRKLKQRRVRLEAAVTNFGDPSFMAPTGGRASRLPALT